MPTSKQTRARWATVLVALVALAAGGCSTSSTTSGLSLVDEQGNHPAGFLATHPGFAVASAGGECTPCHGDDLAGGIARVSCLTAECHHGTIPGWVAVPPAEQPHGDSAKAVPGSSGFVSCQICHAQDFSGGGTQVSCLSAACHGGSGQSPHPAAWQPGNTYIHTTTAEQNASVCAQCHLNGENSPILPPSPPAPAGTPPGCFNNTLCHGTLGVPHPLGAAWVAAPPAAQPHGDDAKAAPGATTGFSYCRACHGTADGAFAGGIAGVSCMLSACHGGTSPHAAAWLPGDTYVHTTTAEGNAPECGFCHYGEFGGGSHPPTPPPAGSGCFNGTLCHGDSGAAPHNVPFLNHTGVTAATFNNPFPAGCAACHAVTGTSPLPGAPLCTSCHTAGSPLTLLNCTSCHAQPPNSTPAATYPNIAGAHAPHLALNNAPGLTPVGCDTCHLGLGTTTQAHYDRAKAQMPPGDAAFPATYNAETGASSFDNGALVLSCLNVSCHGGQATPNWQTGTLNVNADCESCHAFGTAQFNSYSSGQHDPGGHNGFGCLACHNTATLAVNHFTALSTPAMEGPASATIGGGATSIPAGNYNAGNGSCTPQAGVGCHGTETW